MYNSCHQLLLVLLLLLLLLCVSCQLCVTTVTTAAAAAAIRCYCYLLPLSAHSTATLPLTSELAMTSP
jgi:hypothetical protein